MLRRLALRRGEVGFYREPGDPREPFAREDQRPRVAVLARHACVDEDVLQLARAAASGRPHAKAGPAVAAAEPRRVVPPPPRAPPCRSSQPAPGRTSSRGLGPPKL